MKSFKRDLALYAMDFCTFSATTGKLRSLQDENEQLKRELVPDPTLEGGVVCKKSRTCL
ncbi:MAG: hypothetical protein I8H71_14210 [Xanthomonadaceae bacterium]|nr:hypothetical protein [Xanthomonadaceae bacterium]